MPPPTRLFQIVSKRDLSWFLQAEDGIRDPAVTGVQTCALPIFIPDLRHLVVAELAIGVADQIGDGGAVVVAERLQLPDRGGVVVALMARGVGGSGAARECRLRDAGARFARLFLLALVRRRRIAVGRRVDRGDD